MSTRPRGVTLVELVVFIVLVGIAMAALFAAFDTITKGSADPQVRKQVLAIAESLMEEIQLMPFTYCDPDDPATATATGTGDCATAEVAATDPNDPTTREPGPPAEARGDATTPFDNVNDYHRFTMPSGIQDITNAPITGLGAYSADVRVIQAGATLGLAADAALRISVTVTGPGNVSITLEGYRTRYAPKTAP